MLIKLHVLSVVEMLNEEPLHGARAAEIKHIIEDSYNDPNYESRMEPASVKTIVNQSFIEEYR